jgi:hypothetical protein
VPNGPTMKTLHYQSDLSLVPNRLRHSTSCDIAHFGSPRDFPAVAISVVDVLSFTLETESIEMSVEYACNARLDHDRYKKPPV